MKLVYYFYCSKTLLLFTLLINYYLYNYSNVTTSLRYQEYRNTGIHKTIIRYATFYFRIDPRMLVIPLWRVLLVDSFASKLSRIFCW